MAYLLYITAPDKETALPLARTLVEEKLVACANILPGATSVFVWENNVQEAEEAVIIAKTSKERLEQAKTRIKTLHPYDCPCIVAIEIAAGNPEFLEWVEKSTRLIQAR